MGLADVVAVLRADTTDFTAKLDAASAKVGELDTEGSAGFSKLSSALGSIPVPVIAIGHVVVAPGCHAGQHPLDDEGIEQVGRAEHLPRVELDLRAVGAPSPSHRIRKRPTDAAYVNVMACRTITVSISRIAGPNTVLSGVFLGSPGNPGLSRQSGLGFGDRRIRTSDPGSIGMGEGRSRLSRTAIRLARRCFYNTPIQRLPITAFFYRIVFQYGNRGQEISTAFRGLSLNVPNNDITVVPAIVGGYYELLELDILELLVPTCETFVDVGANVGVYTCVASRCSPKTRVIAFEPVPENFGYLQRNIDRNGLRNEVIVERVALGEADGELRISLDEGSIGTHHAVRSGPIDSASSITVPVRSLDSYMEERHETRVDLIKVDVEGYESAVLKGARRLLEDQRPSLLVEFIPRDILRAGYNPRQFLELLFHSYGDVFLIDEARSRLLPCVGGSSDRLTAHKYQNRIANLVAIDKLRHPEHLAALKSVTVATSFA